MPRSLTASMRGLKEQNLPFLLVFLMKKVETRNNTNAKTRMSPQSKKECLFFASDIIESRTT